MLQLEQFTRFSPIYTCPEISWEPYTKAFQPIKIPSSSYIMREGEAPSHLFFLASGLCSVSRLFEDGREYIRYLGGAGAIVGQLPHHVTVPLRFSTRACTDCHGYLLNLNYADKLLDDIGFLRRILQSEQAKIDVLNNRMELQAVQNGLYRLIALLLGLVASHGQEIIPGKWLIPFPLSHQLLGLILLLDRVTISRYMADLTKMQIVEKHHGQYCVILESIQKSMDLMVLTGDKNT